MSKKLKKAKPKSSNLLLTQFGSGVRSPMQNDHAKDEL